jgi:hypothetical protein
MTMDGYGQPAAIVTASSPANTYPPQVRAMSGAVRVPALARQDSPNSGQGEKVLGAPAAAWVQAKPPLSVSPAIIRAGQESDHLGNVFRPAEALERDQFAELLDLRFPFALQEELGRTGPAAIATVIR